jgi:hypothetical protein
MALLERLPAALVLTVETEMRPEVLRAYSYRKLLMLARRGPAQA